MLTLDLREYEDEETEEKGYRAVFGIGLDLSNPPEEQGGSGSPGDVVHRRHVINSS